MIIIEDHIEALIFDLDGTLADTMPIHLEAWVAVGTELGVPITTELINQYLGTPTADLTSIFNKKYGWNLDIKDVRRVKQANYDAIKKAQGKVKPIKHIFAIAEEMQGKMPMSVGTGSSRNNAMASLKDLGTEDWWVTVVTSSDNVKGKPHPDIFLACSDAMNVKPENCLVFEDGPAGIKSAVSAGMPYIDITKL